MITVLYRSSDVVADCLRSVEAAASAAGMELQIILVDNNPGDGTADAAIEAVSHATLITNEVNVGFGRACNQGFEVAEGDWWLLLNPDATVAVDTLGVLVDFMASHRRVGAVAPSVLGGGQGLAESAGMQPGLRAGVGHFLLANRLLLDDRGGPWRGLFLHRRPSLGPRPAEWVSGGAQLLRPSAIQDVGGFDPRFFLYAEDMDLGGRLAKAGWESWLLPSTTVQHSIAASSGGLTDRWYVALHDYYARGASRPSIVLFDLVAALGMAVRALTTPRHALHRKRMWVGARAAMRLAWATLQGQR